MLWILEIITLYCDFWTFQCSEIMRNVQKRSEPKQNEDKKKMC